MTIEFPLKLLREASHDWNIAGNTKTAGQTSMASVDVRSDGGGFWMASLNDIQLWDRTDPLLWRAVRQICNGGVTSIVVPRRDQLPPWPDGAPWGYPDIPHDDESLFSDGAGYTQSLIEVYCDGGASLRAVSMNFRIVNCGQLQGGEAFSVEHPTFGWRLYEIGVVTPIDETHVSVTFNPPLREAVGHNTRLEFDRPRCLMKLASSGAMDLNQTVLPNTTASVKFIESRYADVQ